jgi:DNA-binding NtrC family response regulator
LTNRNRDIVRNGASEQQLDISASPSPAPVTIPAPDADVPTSASTLFSFVDFKDPFVPGDIVGEYLPGPVLSLIGVREFEFVFLFHTPHTRNSALHTKREILIRYPGCQVTLNELQISDPKDYSIVVGRLTGEVRELTEQVRTQNIHVCVSSGTKEMRAAWLLLTLLDVLPAKLLQVSIPTLGSPNVKEIDRDWRAVRDVLMPFMYSSPGRPRTIPAFGFDASDLHTDQSQDGSRSTLRAQPGRLRRPKDRDFRVDDTVGAAETGAKGEADKEKLVVPALDAALQELGIHIRSPILRIAAERAGIAAGSSFPVLLLGETGTGKERFAQLIHRLSPRSSREMVAINCAAIPTELAESYLFGNTKGAYTGAVSSKQGVFEEADRSTLFLDEIAELPLKIQAKLLRIIQDGSFHRVGSTKLLRVDVRIVAATNRDLAKEVDARRFREDLYFRLNVVQIKLPALRERRVEIPDLALFILRQINQRRLTPRRLSKDALARLERYHWPGNVRELQNVLERSVLYSPNENLDAEHLQIEGDKKPIVSLFDVPQPFEGFLLEDYLDSVRGELIRRALETSSGNQAEAGRLLGISRQAINKFIAERSDKPN